MSILRSKNTHQTAVVRAGNLTLQVSKMQEMGLPFEGILDQAELPGEIMELPEALISLPKAIRCG